MGQKSGRRQTCMSGWAEEGWVHSVRSTSLLDRVFYFGRQFRELAALLFFIFCGVQAASADVFYTYDDLGRLKTAQDPAGNISEYVYDPAGNIVQVRQVASGNLAVTGFTPDSGPVGASVTVEGSGFSTTPADNTVRFNGVTAIVTAASATALVTTVPVGALSGPVSVTVAGNTATSLGNFTVTSGAGRAAPTIADFSPKIGAAGTVVSVTGANFDPPPGFTRTELNATVAASSVANTTSLTLTVPPNTGSGRIRVTTAAGVATSSADFIVPPGSLSASTIDQTAHSTLGQTTTISINTTNKSSLVLFDGNQGDYISIDIATFSVSPSSASVGYSVYTPSNALFMSGSITATNRSIHLPPLPRAGTYTIAFSPQNATATLGVLPKLNASLSLSQMTSLQTTFPGQSLRVLFAGTTNQSLGLEFAGFSSTPAGQSATVSVVEPDGATLSTLTATAVGSLLQLPLLPASGTYSVIVTPSGSALAAFQVTLDPGINLSLNGPAATATVATTGEAARFVFNGATGLPIQANMNLQLGGAGAIATIYHTNGSTLASATCNAGPTTCSVNIASLPSSGLFSLVVQPANGAIGSISASIVANGGYGALSPNSPVTVAIASGTSAAFTFSALAGQSPALKLVASPTPNGTYPYDLEITVYRPDGTPLMSEVQVVNDRGASKKNPTNPAAWECELTQYVGTPGNNYTATCHVQLTSVPVSGSYTVVARPIGAVPSSVTLTATLYTQASTGLTAGIATTTTITPPQHAAFTFSALAGQSPALKLVASPTPNGTYPYDLEITVYRPDGTPLMSEVQVVNDRGASKKNPTNPAAWECELTQYVGTPGNNYTATCHVQLTSVPVSGSYTVVARPIGAVPSSVTLTATLTGATSLSAIMSIINSLLLDD